MGMTIRLVKYRWAARIYSRPSSEFGALLMSSPFGTYLAITWRNAVP